MSDPSNDPPSGPDLFGELAHEFAARLRRGERPTLTEYTDRHPELADQIRELFPALVEVEQFGSDVGPETGAFLPGGGREADVPRVLGEYRVVREIGRGGMGVVYEAVQESLGRHVALKVLPDRRRLAPNQLERFIREAKAAALLHHTNIVPVFGVGAHEGVHYYAMQYIEGQGLDAVLAEVKRLRRGAPERSTSEPRPCGTLATDVAQGLLTGHFQGVGPSADPAATTISPGAATDGPGEPSPPVSPGSGAAGQTDSTSSILGPTEAHYRRSVAGLGAQVAEALAHAHAHGILHRDIKPANILMDTQGTAWVTDFGLAKAEGSDELTDPGDVVGTLRYMAPERFRGRSDPRSDVYALGVTLYELLTTEPAFAASDRAALVDQVVREEPRRPRVIDPQLPRDLETIVLKAMAKEPDLRYQSAEGLAEDLRRYLADRPIRARRVNVVERAWRWARRNPSAAALAGSLAAIFVLGLPLVTALWLRSSHLYRLSEQRRSDAEASFTQARGAVDDYLTTVSEDTLLRAPLPGLQPLRRRLLEAALRYYEDFARRHADDPSVRADLAAAYARVGEITAEIGSGDEAIAALRHAEDLYEALARPDRSGRAYATERGRCLARIGKLESDLGRNDKAIALFRGAIELLEPLAAEPAPAPRPRADLAFAHHYLALAAVKLGLEEAERHLRRAIELREALAGGNPEGPAYGTDLSVSLSNLAELQQRAGKNAEALVSVRRARALQKDLVRRWPDDAELRFRLSITTRGSAVVLNALGDREESEHLYRESLAIIERVVAENPAVTQYRRVLATSYAELGQVLIDRDALAEGLECFGRAREQAEVVQRAIPDAINNLITLASIHRGIGKALGKQGKPTAGLESLHRAVEILERIARQDSLAAYDLACTLAVCSELSAALPQGADGGGPGVARRYAGQSVAELRRAIAAGWKNAEWMERDPELRVLHDRDDFREVIQSLGRAIAPRSK